MKKLLKRADGLTLIALIVTILVLLILAGVALTMLTGENGIISQAQKAKEETENASDKEASDLDEYDKYINDVLNGKNTSDDEEETPPETPEEPVDDNLAKVGEIVKEENKKYENNGITAIIPVGFMIVPGCEDITQGLVISDNVEDTEETENIVAKGNQFVWIPVTSDSQYQKNESYDNTNVSEKSYTDTGYLPSMVQPSSDSSSENENAERQAVVLNTKGFYIARYESGVENGKLVSKKNVSVYNDLSQSECKSISKTFIENEFVQSALCSGIQWDVVMGTINGKLDGTGDYFYVAEYDLDRHKGSDIGVTNTGINEADRVYNIYDLEGNAGEFVAERSDYLSGISGTYIFRGGNYTNKTSGLIESYKVKSASYRIYGYGSGDSASSFRMVLYVSWNDEDVT